MKTRYRVRKGNVPKIPIVILRRFSFFKIIIKEKIPIANAVNGRMQAAAEIASAEISKLEFLVSLVNFCICQQCKATNIIVVI